MLANLQIFPIKKSLIPIQKLNYPRYYPEQAKKKWETTVTYRCLSILYTSSVLYYILHGLLTSCDRQVSVRHLSTHILHVASLLHLTTANVWRLAEVAILAQTTHGACAVKLPLESLQGALDILALAYRYNDHIDIFQCPRGSIRPRFACKGNLFNRVFQWHCHILTPSTFGRHEKNPQTNTGIREIYYR